MCLRVCFPICSPATISVSSVYMLFMSLTYMCPCLCVHVRPCLCVCVCVCVCVCAIQFMPEKSDKVPVHFPRFTNHFHGLTTQFDIFSYNRERSPDDSLHCVYAFFRTLSFSGGCSCCSDSLTPAQVFFFFFFFFLFFLNLSGTDCCGYWPKHSKGNKEEQQQREKLSP